MVVFPLLSLFPPSLTVVAIPLPFPPDGHFFCFAVTVVIDFAIVTVEVPVFVVLSKVFTYLLPLSWFAITLFIVFGIVDHIIAVLITLLLPLPAVVVLEFLLAVGFAA